jgi:threonine/homoserine/homoserine lactone efflux protein
MMVGLVGKSIAIGILVSAPMGPIGMLCIQRTLNKGRWHGFVTGLGAALSDMIYAALTCLGMGVVVGFVEANQAPLQIIGSVMLAVFGYYIFRSNPVKSLRKQGERKLSYTQDFITAFLLTFSNVLIVLLYIGLFARLSFVSSEYSLGQLITGVAFIGAGAVFWWFTITTLIAKLKKWFNVRGLWILNRIVGATIIAIAVLGVVSLAFSDFF